MTTLDPSLLSTAEAQHGMLTTRQLTDGGYSAPYLVRLVRAGVLAHPGRGLYAVASMVEPAPEAWHRQLCAGALVMYPDAVLVGTSALLAHGVAVWGAQLARPRIRRPVDRARGMAAFRVRSAVTESAPVMTAWGATQAVAAALVEHALDAGIEPGVASADHALHTGRVAVEELEAAVGSVLAWPRGSRARAMLALADGRRESVGESRCALALQLAGIAVEPQVRIRERSGVLVGRVDFLVRGTKVVVEFDGRVKYEEEQPGVLWAEKRREDRLRRLGYVVARITWADLERPGAVAAKVRSAIAVA